MNKEINISVIGEKNLAGIVVDPNNPIEINTEWRNIANQGSTRSGKTYNIMIILVCLAMTMNGLSISVVAETLPHLKRGAIRDFLDIMVKNDLYNENKHNKTDQIYSFFNGSYIEFFSADNSTRLRGSSRDILFINECNLLKKESYMQLNMRTTQKVIIDYNPADEYHWIYDDILTQDDTLYIHSTYLDNLRFLHPSQVKEIEKLKDMDENYWKIYGLGERGKAQEIVYSNYEIVNEWPESYDRKIYGLDFGFNHPTVLLEIRIKDQIPYIRQRIHESGLTNNDLIRKMSNENIEKNIYIYADNAEPARIEEISRAGYRIEPADKSVKDGIDHCKSLKLKILKDSVDVIKEIRNYKYKIDKQTGAALDDPVKFNDDAMDAKRYGLYTDYLRYKNKVTVRYMDNLWN